MLKLWNPKSAKHSGCIQVPASNYSLFLTILTISTGYDLKVQKGDMYITVLDYFVKNRLASVGSLW